MKPTREFWLNTFIYVLLHETSEEISSPKKNKVSLECKEAIKDPHFI